MNRIYPAAALFILLFSCSSAPKVPPVVYETRNEAGRLLQLGHKSLRQGEVSAALGYYTESYRLYTATDDSEGRVRALDGLGRSGGEESQKQYWDQAGRVARESGDPAVTALSDLLSAERNIHSADPAVLKASLESAQNAARLLSANASDRCRALRVAASAAKALEDYPLALSLLETAAGADRKAKAFIEYASDRYLSASVFSRMGNYPAAEAALKEALDWDKRAENSPGIAGDYRALAMVAQKAGKTGEAKLLFTRASEIFTALNLLNDAAEVTALGAALDQKAPEEQLLEGDSSQK